MNGDLWKAQAWSEKVTFDLKPRDEWKQDSEHGFKNPQVSHNHRPARRREMDEENPQFELDVRTLISSPKWLQLHGLKRNKLTLSHILSHVGFKHKEDYVYGLRKPVSSCYGEGLFQQYMRKDGRIYNLTASKEQLEQFADSLSRAIRLYRQRLEWLTSGSRQLFGVIQERCIAIVIDFAHMSQAMFSLCCDALCSLLREQVSLISKCNLIRAAQDMQIWQEKAVPVTAQTMESATEWIWNLRHMAATTETSPVEAVLQAISDQTLEAVYFFATGDGPARTREILRQKLAVSSCPVHTVSFNAKEEATIQFLKELAHLTSGRFHAFALMNEYDEEGTISINDPNKVDSPAPHPTRKLIGGLPPGAGVREDVFLIWCEIEEARNTLTEVQTLIKQVPQPTCHTVTVDRPVAQSSIEDYISSKKWLEKYGLKVRKLTWSDALADCAFRHTDAVVDVKGKPANENIQTDAETNMKLVNAKYCDRFAHTQWKDGSIVHVYITPEKCKQYQHTMKIALDQMRRRIDWLQQGSRELFGTVIEDEIYILIDVSQSMIDKLQLVKEKIFQLMQEQLRHKTKFNFVRFGTRAISWQDKLAEVNETNLEDAWAWVKGLQVGGSTNTLGAIRLALADTDTQAIYLLTDGRPDQVQLIQMVPIHTIAFNCADAEANGFLYELSKKTRGRFHSYNSDVSESSDIPPFVSEDICLLKSEMEQGRNDLERVEKLHAECVLLDWYHSSKGKEARNSGTGEGQTNCYPRSRSAQSASRAQVKALDNNVHIRPRSALDWISTTHRNHRDRCHTYSLNDAKNAKQLQRKNALYAAHTKTSLLRTLSRTSKIGEDLTDRWMLPENKEMFLDNYRKELQVLDAFSLPASKTSQTKARRHAKTSSLDVSSARWLKTNGLVAKRLTIMDALAPTAIPQTATYVPILDKHVVSRVFNEVLPLAHVGNSKLQITLVNPLAVNLESYKERLLQAIQTYNKRLNLMVWRALTREEQNKFSSGEGPISFSEHKEALVQTLERLGWPIAKQDLTLLEDEIQAGYSYQQQACDLQKAAREMLPVPPTGLHSKQRKAGMQDMEPPFRQHITGKSKPTNQPRQVLDTLKGQRVIARSEINGFYYSGLVSKCICSRKAIVHFSKGETQIIPTEFIIRTGGATPCPPLKVGDFVLVRSNKEGEYYHWVPGMIIATPQGARKDDKFYTVLKYNNRKEHTLRRGLNKISKTQYIFACHYIRETPMVDRTLPNVQFARLIAKAHSSEGAEKITSSLEEERQGKKSNRSRSKKPSKKHKESSNTESEDEQSASTSELGQEKRDCTSDEEYDRDHKTESDSEVRTNGSTDWICEPAVASSASQSGHSSQSTTTSASSISTPRSSPQPQSPPMRGGSPSQAHSPTAVAQLRLEEVAQQLQEVLTEQREQQEAIKEYLKISVDLKEDQRNSKLLEDQKHLITQQQELLRKLENLPPTLNPHEEDTPQEPPFPPVRLSCIPALSFPPCTHHISS